MRCPFLSVPTCSALILGALLGVLAPTPASAQNRGFQLNRYEPTAAGEWSFWVDHPWYSKTRAFAAGLTLDYGHNPLIVGFVQPDGRLIQTQSILANQLVGHVDLAGSFLDRVLLTASLPVTFLENGQAVMSTTLPSPASGAYVSDPRLGAMVRVFGQPYASGISMSLGGQLWIPLRAFTGSIPEQGSDQGVRGLLRVALGGLKHHVLWSANVGALFRPEARLGAVSDPTGSTAGHELQLSAAVAYADLDRRFTVGPELVFATALTTNTLQQYSSSLELLVGGHYNIARLIDVGLAGGVGILRQAGTPDGRLLLRVAYAPMPKPVPKDRDRDGVPDPLDRCPDEAQGNRPDSDQPGCPQRDRDADGVYDREDQCPAQAQGEHPDPAKPGCPTGDKDGDGISDYADQCPEQPNSPIADSSRLGCPAPDKDGDGVSDPQDVCPHLPKGQTPDPTRLGCPAVDKDGDGVWDHEDPCADVPAGSLPDPVKKGCPLADRDHDLVPDATDACPDQAGVPDLDAKKSGCPTKLLEIRSGQIVIKEQLFFGNKKDVIKKQSFALLQAVATTLNAVPQIKKLRIEGHTDNKGKPDFNLDLSARRAHSVMRWLVEHQVAASRLEAQGYGDTRPIADNKTTAGKAQNRRVDFVIMDPPQERSPSSEAPVSAPPPTPVPTVPVSSAATPDEPARRHHHRIKKETPADAADEPTRKRHHRAKKGTAAADPEAASPEAAAPALGRAARPDKPHKATQVAKSVAPALKE